MAEELRKTAEDKIKEIESQLISNSKDAHFAKNLIQQLTGLYQMDKLIDVPLKDVKGTIDFGANKLYRTVAGFIWECKGGMTTLVDYRMFRVYAMLNTLFELHNKENKTEDEQKLYDSFSTAVAYIMQAPIFSSLDERALFQNATSILSTYQEYCVENYTNAEAVEESEEDIKANVAAEQSATALEILAESPLPPEDNNES